MLALFHLGANGLKLSQFLNSRMPSAYNGTHCSVLDFLHRFSKMLRLVSTLALPRG